MSKSWSPRSHSSRNPIGPAPANPPGAARRRVLMGAAVALLAIAVVALPAAAQNQSVTPTAAATGTNPPAKPHNLRVSPSHDQVTVTWTASTDPTVTRYAVLRRNRTTDAVGVFHVIAANAGPGTGYTDSSVSASGSYVYRVKSVSPTGVSQWSGYARADTPAAPVPAPEPPPPPPTTTTTQPPPTTTTTTQAPPPTTTTQAPPPTTTTTTITTTTTQAPAPEPVTTTPELALAPVIGFTLVDATNQAVLATFSKDVWLELDDPDNGSFGVRVDTGAGVTIGSVRLELSGQKTTARTENWAPYSLYGDDGSALHGASLPAGGYTLRATAYPSRGLQGNPLGTLEVSFTVTASEPATTTSDDPAPEGAVNQDEGPLQYQEAGTEDFVPPVLTYQVFTDAETVPLNWDLKPSGLVAGNEFRLLFITSGAFSPISTDIDDYNDTVQSHANSNTAHRSIRPYASGFRVVGSTAAVDAIDNTSTTWTNTAKGLPIYWLNGNKVADDYEDFYDGTWDDESNPKGRSGAGFVTVPDEVWTGSTSSGTANSTTPLGGSSIEFGKLNGAGGPLSASGSYTRISAARLPYYALSEVFTVGSTANSAPVFTDTAPAARSIAENPGSGANIGAPVAATDVDTGDTLRYSLGGTDAASFTIVSTSGQLRTKSGVAYNFEAKSGYSVTVRATDGTHTPTNTATIAVTITLTDVDEPPAAPRAPEVSEVEGMTDRLNVSWRAPANTGPPITDYDVRYRVGDSGSWNDVSHTGTGLTATITALTATLTDVQVQVRATNPEGTGAWSEASSAPANICGRTAIVADAIVAATPAQDSCATVSAQAMAALTLLDVTSRPGFYSLKVGDFDGLTGLIGLDLSDTFLRSLPAGVFGGLPGLRNLDFSGTSLDSLSAGVFDGLGGLTRLDLSDTNLDSLPAGVFANLSSLTDLNLSDNPYLQTADWRVGIFDGLDSLQTLRLADTGYRTSYFSGTGVDILHDDIFRGLGNLRELDMRPGRAQQASLLAFLPLTSLETYNGRSYTRPVDAPRNLTATMSDRMSFDPRTDHLDGAIMYRESRNVPVTRYRSRIVYTGREMRWCQSVRLTWAAPAGVSGITGYKILRTHNGHPVSRFSFRNPRLDHTRYAYDIATVGAGTTSYVHEPLMPGINGHKFTYYVAAITNNGDGFPAVAKVEADLLIPYGGSGSSTTGPGSCQEFLRWF